MIQTKEQRKLKPKNRVMLKEYVFENTTYGFDGYDFYTLIIEGEEILNTPKDEFGLRECVLVKKWIFAEYGKILNIITIDNKKTTLKEILTI